MKTLLTAVVATIGLSALSCHAFESNQTIAGSDMQHYVFTYNFNKPVNSVSTQFEETRQTLDYVLALDIQDQV
ncbi:MAG: UDP-N-acetylmuramate-alanine ligase [Cocleimonas sp.]|jgi:UDP-N-acetylmuramate-alanine ligase